ncbi:MAG: hypothetical protein CMJ50_01930 [Planctomycetaceae bacterium]|nr:hypothetical protein [Planctomycetaceae bacterium]
MERDDRPTILTATVANRVQSLWLVLSSFPAEERADQVASMMATAVDPETTFADLLIARRDKQIVAATWGTSCPWENCSCLAAAVDRGRT